MPELVLTLNCLELLSLPPTLSFLGSHSVTWPLTISFSSKMAKAKLQTVALLLGGLPARLGGPGAMLSGGLGNA